MQGAEGAQPGGARALSGRAIAAMAAGLLIVAALLLLLAPRPAQADLLDRWLDGEQKRLSLEVAKRGHQVKLTVLHQAGVSRFAVKLNGNDITEEFGGSGWGAGRRHLGRHHGLRYGRNVVKAKIVLDNGSKRVKKESFRLSKKRPIASAGVDVEGFAGDRIRLDGSRSRHHGRGVGAGLHYRWRLIRKPAGSQATVERARARKPMLRTDELGTYRVRLEVRGRRGSQGARRSAPTKPHRDVVQFTAHGSSAYQGTGTLVHSIPINADGPATGLRIIGPEGPMTAKTGGTDEPQFVAAIWDRKSGEMFDPGTASGFYEYRQSDFYEAFHRDVQSAVKQSDHSVLVVMQGTPRDATAAANAARASALAGSSWGTISPEEMGPVAAAGVPYMDRETDDFCDANDVVTWSSCRGHAVIDDREAAGRLSGVIARDAATNYSLMPAYAPTHDLDSLTFESKAEGSSETQNKMRVGDVTYASRSLPAGAGGFQALVLDARTLQPLGPAADELLKNAEGSFQDQSFTVQTSDGAEVDKGGLAALRWILAATWVPPRDDNFGQNPIEGDQLKAPRDARIVILQSIGDPLAPGEKGSELDVLWRNLAPHIEALGGSQRLFVPRTAANCAPSSDASPCSYEYALAASSSNAPPHAGTASFPSPHPGDLSTGSVALTESSSSQHPIEEESTDESIEPEVETSGALTRDAYWFFQPSGGSGDVFATPEAGQPAATDFAALATSIERGNNPAMLPTAFPGARDPEWVAALHWAAQQLGLNYAPGSGDYCYYPPEGRNDVRTSYCGGPGVGWGAKLERLKSLNPPSDGGFSRPTWNEVKAQLEQEITMIRALNDFTTELQRPFGTDAALGGLIDVKATVGEINNYVLEQSEVDKEKRERYDSQVELGIGIADGILSVIGTLFGIGAEEHAAFKAIEVIAHSVGGVLVVAKDSFALDASGSGTAGPILGTANEADIARKLEAQLEGQFDSVARMRDLIAADWRKLQEFQDGEFKGDFSQQPGAQVAPTTTLGLRRHAYALAVSADYEARLILCMKLTGRRCPSIQFGAWPQDYYAFPREDCGYPVGQNSRSVFSDEFPNPLGNDYQVRGNQVYMLVNRELPRNQVLGRGEERANEVAPPDEVLPDEAFGPLETRDGAPILPANPIENLGLLNEQWFSQTWASTIRAETPREGPIQSHDKEIGVWRQCFREG